MLKPLTFLLGCIPLVYSLYQVYLLQTGGAHSLGADPGKDLVHLQGEWAIRFLVITLLISPVRQLTPFRSVIRVRRMLGLFAFFYASLHLLAYMVFLLGLDFSNIAGDVIKRPYITAGFAGLLLMLPLAITSTDNMMRRLRGRWQVLHRAIYLVAILAVVHLVWQTRSSYQEAAVYGLIIGALLVYRLAGWIRQRKSRKKAISGESAGKVA